MNTESPKQSNLFLQSLQSGLASAKENALPGLILWIFASVIVAGYYFVPAVTAALTALGSLKASAGYAYSAIATALFGGIIPFIWRYVSFRLSGKNGNTAASPWNVAAWKAGVFLALFWAWKGVEVDFLYRLQAVLFGNGTSPLVIIPKVAVDQFVYNPIWAGWTQIVAYWFLENSFTRSSLTDRALWSTIGPRLVTILVSTWGVWIPMVSIIYAMPPNLQIPLFNIALCFWGLMLASLTKEK